MITKKILFTLIVLINSIYSSIYVFAGSYDDQAILLMQTAGRSKGICVVPMCGDGNLAMAIARNSSMIVYGTDENISMARKTAFSAGELNRTVYFDNRTGYTSALAKWTADLMLVLGATGSDLNDALAQELYRVLSPWRGVALVGGGTSGDITSFKAKCQALGLECTDVTGVTGVSLKVLKPKEPGMDERTHFQGTPSNNPVSTDTVAGGPYMLQFISTPFINVAGTWRMAGGRLIEFKGLEWNKEGTEKLAGWMHCKNAYNGRILWQRQFPITIDAKRPNMVVSSDKIFMMHPTKPAVVVIDAETGDSLHTIWTPNEKGHVKWLALENNILYILIGPEGPSIPISYFSGNNSINASIQRNKLMHGKDLYAYNLNTNIFQWNHNESNWLIDCRSIAVSNGRVYFFSELSDYSSAKNVETVKGYRLASINAFTGNELIENKDAEWTNILKRYYENIVLREWVPGLIASPDAIRLRMASLNKNDSFFFDPVTLQLLWKEPIAAITGYRTFAGFFLNGKFYQKGKGYDAKNGAVVVEGAGWGNGCGVRSWSPNDGVISSVIEKQTQLRLKTDCGQGAYVAGGLLNVPQGHCHCPSLWRGDVALASIKDLVVTVSPDNTRLETGASSPASIIQDQFDWATYRHNNNRNNATPVNLNLSSMSLQWQYTPGKPYSYHARMNEYTNNRQDQSTEPVSVGGLVYLGGSDGVVKCLNPSGSSTPVWEYQTGGRIYAPPTISGGSVYVGSFDGFVYCLNALTGQLIWRYRAAPYDQRIMIAEHLSNRWPVLTGVLVHEGKAYFAAGIIATQGIHVYCVNAENGQLEWHNSKVGVSTPTQPTFQVEGFMTVMGNRLLVKGYMGWPAAFNLATGEYTNPLPDWILNGSSGLLSNLDYEARDIKVGDKLCGGIGKWGRDICIIDTNTVLLGGRRWSMQLNQTAGDRRAGQIIVKLDENGQDNNSRVNVKLCGTSFISPSYDDSLMLVVPGGEVVTDGIFGLVGLNTKIARQKIKVLQSEEYIPAGIHKDWPAEIKWFKEKGGGNYGGLKNSPAFKWMPVDSTCYIYATALAANAAIVIYGPGDKPLANIPYELRILNRENGAVIYKLIIPGTPMQNGLCIDRNGRILVTLRDGSVLSYSANNSVETYTLTVNNGTGSGTYTAGKVVNIEANKPLPEMEFDKWTGETAGVADVNASSTTFTMPQSNANITASYRVSTSLDELNYQVGIYPNPSEGRFVIRATQPVTLVKIFNASGTLIYINNRYEVNSEIEIDSEQPEGTIMVEVTLQNGHKKVEKVIINK